MLFHLKFYLDHLSRMVIGTLFEYRNSLAVHGDRPQRPRQGRHQDREEDADDKTIVGGHGVLGVLAPAALRVAVVRGVSNDCSVRGCFSPVELVVTSTMLL